MTFSLAWAWVYSGLEPKPRWHSAGQSCTLISLKKKNVIIMWLNSSTLDNRHTLTVADLSCYRVSPSCILLLPVLFFPHQMPDKMSSLSTGQPLSSTLSSRRCPCVGGRSSCVCSQWLISNWSEWSWRLVWVWAPWKGSTRCWGCGANVPVQNWVMSFRPCITWIYLDVLSCCRKTWRSCSGDLILSKASHAILPLRWCWRPEAALENKSTTLL